MKLNLAFALDNAPWPVFLVDDSGIVRESNSSAVSTLGTIMEGEPALSAAAWAPENELTVDEFLHRVERSSSPMTVTKFRAKGGITTEFNTYVCSVTRDRQKYFLFQLLPSPPPDKAVPQSETKPAAGATTAPPKGPEGDTEFRNAQKQKLDCALQLARTVSLDFNNALTSILGHTSLVLAKIEPSHPWRPSLVEVEKSAQRAAEIAQDLAAFSRQEKDSRARVAGNLNEVLRRTVGLFQKTAPANILWTLQLEKRLYIVKFEEAKMEQAFTRILENAVEAVGKEGRIMVRTYNQTVEHAVHSPTARLSPGHYVCAEVSDDGSGIPSDVLPRVFEPFFTTKKTPDHRGLGLAWVYGIVTNHGGTVAVTSPPAQGATVRILLPAKQKIVKDETTRFEDLRGSHTILMVDDEEMLLTLGQAILTNFGYKVLTANNGQRAIELFYQAPTQIDLVITDLVMPGMSGRELIDQLRRISPAVRIVSTSGYLRPTSEEEDEETYLRKPFTSQALLRKVKQVLMLARAQGS